METLSRTRKYNRKKKAQDFFAVIAFFLLTCLLLYALYRYLPFPAEAALRREIARMLAIFNFSFLLAYMLAIALMTGGWFKDAVAQHVKRLAQLRLIGSILFYWIGLLALHLYLYLSSEQVDPLLFRLGMTFFFAGLLLTGCHLVYLFAIAKMLLAAQRRSLSSRFRQEANEMIAETLFLYDAIRKAMQREPEVERMMRGNEFDDMMERAIGALRDHMRKTIFNRSDLQEIASIHGYLQNLWMIVQQHPDVAVFSAQYVAAGEQRIDEACKSQTG
ncbi:hypothetical protein BSNK01_29070 [Bacillaceae bacterium]